MEDRLKPGRKPVGDKKKKQVTFYIEQYIEDFLGKEFCKEFCQNQLLEEYNKRIKNVLKKETQNNSQNEKGHSPITPDGVKRSISQKMMDDIDREVENARKAAADLNDDIIGEDGYTDKERADKKTRGL